MGSMRSMASERRPMTACSCRYCGRICIGAPLRTELARRILRRMNVHIRAKCLALGAGALITLASCGSVPTREKPLSQVVPLTAPVFAPGVEGNSDKLFVVLTFSGGGKRAAAFSYGVLEALRDIKVTTPDGEQRALLDEIDLISAVSGGAFTAAYYALHGHETFESYAPRFLNHDTEKDLWRKVLAPVNWGRLGNSMVSRSDLEVEYLDRKSTRLNSSHSQISYA